MQVPSMSILLFEVSVNEGDQLTGLVDYAQEEQALEVVVPKDRHCSVLPNHKAQECKYYEKQTQRRCETPRFTSSFSPLSLCFLRQALFFFLSSKIC